jgi:thiol-disulfide isomerase/thioredoxin
VTAPSAAPSPRPSPTGSAYFGCGEPIPPEHLWDETLESEVFEAISAAKSCARSSGRRLLLEFVAPWCGDCREMAKLDETPVVSAVLRARFERVRINVGKWDRHEALRHSYEVKALATYIVIDPETSKQLAKTTLEPVTRRGPKLTAEDWARWLSAH